MGIVNNCSLPHSQVPANFPCTQSARSSPWPHNPLPEDPSYCNPIYTWFLSLKCPYQNPVCTSPLIRATRPPHLIFLDLIIQTILGEEYRSLSSSLCSFLYPLLPNPSDTQIFSSEPYSQTPLACVPPSVCATN